MKNIKNYSGNFKKEAGEDEKHVIFFYFLFYLA